MTGQIRSWAKQFYGAIPFKRQLFQLLRAGPDLPPAIYQHLHFEGPFTVSVGERHRFRINSYASHVENELFWAGYGETWEGASLKAWASLARDREGLVLDIGANTGVYALAAAAVRQGRQVVAFEPVSRMAERLAANVALNGFPIRIEQKAVSDRTGRLPIYDAMVEHNYSASLEGQGPSAKSYEVDVCSLDDYLKSLGDPPVAAIKIDVERHEPAAVKGMLQTLARCRPPILIEILDDEIGGSVGELVEGLEYRMFHIDEKAGLIPASALHPLGGDNWNHLLCSHEDFMRANLEQLLAKA